MRRCSAEEVFIFVAEVVASIFDTVFVAMGIITASKASVMVQMEIKQQE